jgi:hypothetical protein
MDVLRGTDGNHFGQLGHRRGFAGESIPFQTNRGFARELRCFQGFELAENGSLEDSGTGPTFTGLQESATFR